MSKTGWVLALVGLVLAGVLAWWWGPRMATVATPAGSKLGAEAPISKETPRAGAAGRAAPAVEVAPVEVARLIDEVTAVGTLKSRQSVMVRPEVSGRVVAIGFRNGAPVRRGQLLYQLDDTLPMAELAQAQAQLAVAQANLRRTEELVARAFVAQRVLDESRAAVQVAQAQVDLARARVARMRIVAPFDGVAGIGNVHIGDYVREGTDLVHLEDTARLLVDFRLPERYQAQVRIGQPVVLRFDALPARTFSAAVQAIDPLIDEQGRALRVRAALAPERDLPLRPGMFARVALVLGVVEDALLIPEEAVVVQGDQMLVFRIDRPEATDAPTLARRVPVRLGMRKDGRVQVLDGLRANDIVVVAGQQRLQRDSMPVRIVEDTRRG